MTDSDVEELDYDPTTCRRIADRESIELERVDQRSLRRLRRLCDPHGS